MTRQQNISFVFLGRGQQLGGVFVIADPNDLGMVDADTFVSVFIDYNCLF
ncbi:MAG: hypothetical protein VB876_15015 [Pirellulales bacterium]